MSWSSCDLTLVVGLKAPLFDPYTLSDHRPPLENKALEWHILFLLNMRVKGVGRKCSQLSSNTNKTSKKEIK